MRLFGGTAAAALLLAVTATGPRPAPAEAASCLQAASVLLLAGQGLGDLNRTKDRFGVHGTDLGVLWRDSRGRTAIAFGDTYGSGWGGRGAGPETADWRLNTLAHTADRVLSDGLRIDSMVTDRPGHAKQILGHDPAVPEVTVIPTAAISASGRDVIHYMSVRSWDTGGRWTTNYSGLAYSDDGGESWTKPASARWANSGGGARFQLGAFARDRGFVYLFGTPNGRHGDAYLARVREDAALDPSAYSYWTAAGWLTGGEDRTVPVLTGGEVGELSVLYNRFSHTWIALHLDERRAAIVLRTAPAVTGPWTAGQPVVTGSDHPGLYGAFLHPASADGPDLFFAMSEWDPYHVEFMRLHLTASCVEALQHGGR